MHPTTQDTIVAISPPPGAGGIAVLRLSGSSAFDIARMCFSAFAKTSQVVDRQAVYGVWRFPDSTEILDDVVVTAFKSPRSYTGEDVIEISCHGSTYVQKIVLESCIQAGARIANPGEYTQRAFLNGRLDLTQAEGVGDLIGRETAAAHRLAIDQMKGGISRAMAALRSELITFAALIELENDFGEEDVSFADRNELKEKILSLSNEIQRLQRSFRLGQAIKNGVPTVIAGRPNAGKSTLLNALLDDDRAIVSDIAGTTRDTIEAELVIQGVVFRLVDTAGIREATDQIEALGVERTFAAIDKASVLVYVWDVVLTAPEEVENDLRKLLKPGIQLLAVANKMDLNPYAKLEHYNQDLIDKDRFVPMSAKHEMNVGLLKEKLFSVGVGEMPPKGSAILTQARHAEALGQADKALHRVLESLEAGFGGDLVALDLRQALHFVGEVTGEITVEDLLGSIFSSFCIGK